VALELEALRNPERLLIADLVGDRLTREGLAALREDADELLARLGDVEASAETLPRRRTYLLLVTGFLRRFLEAPGS
jgi:hypothetical protein